MSHAVVRLDHQPASRVAQSDCGGREFRRPPANPRGWAVRTSHGITRRHGLAVGQDRQRLVLPAFLVALRLRRRQGLAQERRVPGDEGNLPILGRPSENAARRHAGGPDGWSPEHGPRGRRRELQPGNCLGPVQQLMSRRREALGVDADYRQKIAAMRDRLAVPGSADGASSRMDDG